MTDPRAAAMSEADLMRHVERLAAGLGWTTYHTHDSRSSAPGFPDLVLAKPPRLMFRELKTAGGRLTPAQRNWLALLSACGLDTAVWRPTDLLTLNIARQLTTTATAPAQATP